MKYRTAILDDGDRFGCAASARQVGNRNGSRCTVYLDFHNTEDFQGLAFRKDAM